MASEPAHALAGKLLGALIMAAGAAITAVFGGGLLVFLWVDISGLANGAVQVTRLMSTLLVGPIVGGAPALLGLVLMRMGWRRIRPPTPEPPADMPADLGDAP